VAPSVVVNDHAVPELTDAPLAVIVATDEAEAGVKPTEVTPFATDIVYDSDETLKVEPNVPVVASPDRVASADAARLTTS
jgi:hypothetical protein